MVAIPWKFESSCAHQSLGVVAQLIERYVRIVEVVGLSPISSTKIRKCRAIAALLKSLRGYGGMVDAEDLKSFGHCDRVGSSPTIPTTHSPLQNGDFLFGCVAQLVRALRSHRRGRWFESNHIHQIEQVV